MSPRFAETLKDQPYLFRNKLITTNMINNCLFFYGFPELFFLSGINDFHEKATPERASFLFSAFCILDENNSCVINCDAKLIKETQLKLDTGIKDYYFANSNSKNKKIATIPMTLQDCFDPLLSTVLANLNGTLSQGLGEYGAKYLSYHETKYSLFNNKKPVLKTQSVTKQHKDYFLNEFNKYFGTMLKLEMKTMFSVAKEVENMK